MKKMTIFFNTIVIAIVIAVIQTNFDKNKKIKTLFKKKSEKLNLNLLYFNGIRPLIIMRVQRRKI